MYSYPGRLLVRILAVGASVLRLGCRVGVITSINLNTSAFIQLLIFSGGLGGTVRAFLPLNPREF